MGLDDTDIPLQDLCTSFHKMNEHIFGPFELTGEIKERMIGGSKCLGVEAPVLCLVFDF